MIRTISFPGEATTTARSSELARLKRGWPGPCTVAGARLFLFPRWRPRRSEKFFVTTAALARLFCAMSDTDKRPHYYDARDLARFSEIKRSAPDLAKSYFDYYGKAMGPGALSEREKALIALAVSHALKCPYCIDAYTQTCLEKGADEPQMMEAVHVAAAMAAGISLVHSVQMMNRVDELSL